MRTFKEMAETARIVEPSQKLGTINYCRMIAELAEAMNRLELNLAFQLAHLNVPASVQLTQEMHETITATWLGHLRAPTP
jgi:hypothetical protein